SAMRDRRDMTKALTKANVKGVIIHGTKDPLISEESAFAPTNDHLIHRSTDSGHMGMLETPDAFVAIIEEAFK
ncbi:MAG TPA: alpha/beta hydrolase, partial [Exiguobacterium sp.]|nr:alpha/beta hydrolase [Exiguobacterium sp.]